jgi:hypothetical protein
MTPFLDDRGRLFGKVNLVDLLVLVALVALAAFALTRTSGAAAEQTDIRTTFIIERIRPSSGLQINEGDQVRDDTGTLLGVVEEAERMENILEVPTDQGELNPFPSPLFEDVRLVLKGTGNVSASPVRIGSVPLLVGKIIVLRGPTYEVRATLREVTW